MKPAARVRTVLFSFIAACSLACETQQAAGPPGSPSLSMGQGDASGKNVCGGKTSKRNPNAPDSILCAIQIPGNPLISVAKSWVDPATERLLLDDQSNQGVDVVDAESHTFLGRASGFVGAATFGGGTATTNGQGPNSMVPTDPGTVWVSDGNSTVRVVDVNAHAVVASVSTAMPACNGGTATEHYCGRVNEMTYDPEDRIILVENPNPLDTLYCMTHSCASTAAVSYPGTGALPPYATLISADPPYTILGRISFSDAKGTTEGPVWNHKLHRFLVPVPTCSGAAGATACAASTGATQYVAVIDPGTRTVEKTYPIPDCAHLMPQIAPAGTGMINDMAIDERDQHVILPVCGKGNLVFDAQTGDVVNVVTEISSSDETWFNDGDGHFYVVSGVPGGATPGGGTTTSLGVIDGRTGMWLQNVLNVGGRTPSALAETNQAFTVVAVTAAQVSNPATDNTACVPFGFRGTGCVTVFGHVGDAADAK